LHLNFLANTPDTCDITVLEKIKSTKEQIKWGGSVVYFHAPDGKGKSKLAASMERLHGVKMTSRNWRTVCKLIELMEV
jgi:uncharacterized protein (DUF1697 family)